MGAESSAESSEVSRLEARYKDLVSRREALRGDITTVEAELGARRRRLKSLMEEADSEGFDPNNIQEEIRKGTEVIRVKLDAFQADIEAGEKMVRPMMEEIGKG
jgi:chromosome segregation ATPase